MKKRKRGNPARINVDCFRLLSSEYGTHKTVTAGFNVNRAVITWTHASLSGLLLVGKHGEGLSGNRGEGGGGSREVVRVTM
jgi:hypothetical protein